MSLRILALLALLLVVSPPLYAAPAYDSRSGSRGVHTENSDKDAVYNFPYERLPGSTETSFGDVRFSGDKDTLEILMYYPDIPSRRTVAKLLTFTLDKKDGGGAGSTAKFHFTLASPYVTPYTMNRVLDEDKPYKIDFVDRDDPTVKLFTLDVQIDESSGGYDASTDRFVVYFTENFKRKVAVKLLGQAAGATGSGATARPGSDPNLENIVGPLIGTIDYYHTPSLTRDASLDASALAIANAEARNNSGVGGKPWINGLAPDRVTYSIAISPGSSEDYYFQKIVDSYLVGPLANPDTRGILTNPAHTKIGIALVFNSDRSRMYGAIKLGQSAPATPASEPPGASPPAGLPPSGSGAASPPSPAPPVAPPSGGPAFPFEHDRVLVEYHGPDTDSGYQFREYSFGDLKGTDFSFNIDNASENWAQITYRLGQFAHTYKIQAFVPFSKGFGSTDAEFVVHRDGVECHREVKTFALLSNTHFNLLAPTTQPSACQLEFDAEYERLTLKTDVQLHNISIAQADIDDVKNQFMKGANRDAILRFRGEIQNINSGYRVVDIDNAFDFERLSDSPVIAIRALYDGFDEEDNTGQKRAMVITKNKEIKYFVLLQNAFFEDFLVFKPKQKVSVDMFPNYTALLNYFTAKQGAGFKNADRLVPNNLKNAASISGSISVEDPGNLDAYQTMGTTAGVVNLGRVSGSEARSAFATARTVAMTSIKKAGIEAAKALGKRLIFIGAGTAALPITVAGVVVDYSVWYFTDTDTYSYDSDRLFFNWDTEFWSWDEKKINWMMYREYTTGPQQPAVTPTAPPPSGAKDKIYLEYTPEELATLKSKSVISDSDSIAAVYSAISSALAITDADNKPVAGISKKVSAPADNRHGKTLIEVSGIKAGKYRFTYTFKNKSGQEFEALQTEVEIKEAQLE